LHYGRQPQKQPARLSGVLVMTLQAHRRLQVALLPMRQTAAFVLGAAATDWTNERVVPFTA
jgi:hypothetical protein